MNHIRSGVGGIVLLLAGLQMTACATMEQRPATLSSDQELAVHFLQPLFSRIVGDSGEIEQSELDEYVHLLFSELDADDSGSASFSEYLRTRPLPKIEEEQYVYTLMDTDRSGDVSKREYRVFLYRVVRAADTNKDGLVSDLEAEMTYYQAPRYLRNH